MRFGLGLSLSGNDRYSLSDLSARILLMSKGFIINLSALLS